MTMIVQVMTESLHGNEFYEQSFYISLKVILGWIKY